MGSMMMKVLFTVGSTSFCWAGKEFMFRGLYVWAFKRNIRIIALNRFSNWTAKYED